MSSSAGEKPLGELFTDLATGTATLVRQEITLARVEMSDTAALAAKQAAFVGIGASLMHVAVLTLAAAIVAGLTLVLPIWLAALIVGLVLVVVGAGLLRKGMSALQHMKVTPVQTVRTLEETQQWARKELDQ